MALDEVDDCTKALLQTFQQIEDLALTLKTTRFFVFTSHPKERAALLALVDGSHTLLEDIGARVESIRGEFGSLQHSDFREQTELEALLTPKTGR